MIRAVPPVLLAGGFVLALATAVAAQTPAPSAQAPRAAPPQVAPAPGSGQPAAVSPGPARSQQGGVAPTATERGVVERRRNRTYAGCNRAALRRALRGGERRRFITRCRLGYDIPPRPR
jgi:hypothetical protein